MKVTKTQAVHDIDKLSKKQKCWLGQAVATLFKQSQEGGKHRPGYSSIEFALFLLENESNLPTKVDGFKELTTTAYVTVSTMLSTLRKHKLITKDGTKAPYVVNYSF